jgi:hypothetical protein
MLGEPLRPESLQHRVPGSGEDFSGQELAGDQPERCPRVGEGDKAAGDFFEFTEDRFAVARNGFVADLP